MKKVKMMEKKEREPGKSCNDTTKQLLKQSSGYKTEALLSNKLFEDDLRAVISMKRGQARYFKLAELEKKWGVFPRIDDLDGFEPNREKIFKRLEWLIAGQNRAVTAIMRGNRKIKSSPADPREIEALDTDQTAKDGSVHEYEYHPFIRQRRYLHVKVDLWHGQTEIEAEFKEMVTAFKTIVKPSTNRKTTNKRVNRALPDNISDFDILRMKKEQGMGFTQIAQKIVGRKGRPQDDPEIKAKYEAVRNAYSRARKVVKNTSPIAKSSQ